MPSHKNKSNHQRAGLVSAKADLSHWGFNNRSFNITGLLLLAVFIIITSLANNAIAEYIDLSRQEDQNSGHEQNTSAIGARELISDIFIEATGNNKYEAKIKAHQQGMQRALILLADKIGVDMNSLEPAPYHRLKEVFNTITIHNELSQKEKYSATVSYEYSQGKFYKLLLDYGDSKIDDIFYEYLVLPVFKQSSFLNIWEPDKRWNDFWGESRNLLSTHKLYYPPKSLFASKKITSENIFNLSYDEFIDIFRNRLFKGILIVTAEFFTDRHTRESLVRVTTHVVHADGSPNAVFEKDYPLNQMDDIGYTVDLVIDKIIDDFGMLRSHQENDNEELEQWLPEDEPENTPIVMNFDVYDPDELQIVEDKLERVSQVESFRIEHDYNNRYKIVLYTNVSEFELAEGLYLNGLSYKIYGNLYHLIDVKKGG